MMIFHGSANPTLVRLGSKTSIDIKNLIYTHRSSYYFCALNSDNIMAFNLPTHWIIIPKNGDKIQRLLFYTSVVLYRKCKESEKTLEKQLHLVYCIADFIS